MFVEQPLTVPRLLDIASFGEICCFVVFFGFQRTNYLMINRATKNFPWQIPDKLISEVTFPFCIHIARLQIIDKADISEAVFHHTIFLIFNSNIEYYVQFKLNGVAPRPSLC